MFARLSKPQVTAVHAPLAAEGRVTIYAPVAFELGYAARTSSDYQELTKRLGSFDMLPTSDADHRRALEVQAMLAALGQHRALSLVDALVAAVAEARSSTTTLASSWLRGHGPGAGVGRCTGNCRLTLAGWEWARVGGSTDQISQKLPDHEAPKPTRRSSLVVPTSM